MLQPDFPPKLDSAVSLVDQDGAGSKGDGGGDGGDHGGDGDRGGGGDCGDHGGGGGNGGDLLCDVKPKLVAQPRKEAGRPGISTWGGQKS